MRVAVIPAAGKGARFNELGTHYAKTLLPLNGIPIIQHIIERLLPDFDEIRIVVSSDSKQLEKFLNSLCVSKIQIVIIPSDGPQGPGRSFMEAVVGNEDYVFLHLSDVLFNLNFTGLSGDWVTSMSVNDPSRWCMINESSELLDKPSTCADGYQAITGAYSFSNPADLRKACEAAFHVATSGEFQLSQIFKHYNVRHKFELHSHKSEDFLDFGTIEEYFKNNKSNKNRYFNDIKFDRDVVRKSSIIHGNKLLKEALWLKHAPRELQKFLPKIYDIDFKGPAYHMERIHSLKLRDLFIYLDRRVATWEPIFSEINLFLELCKKTEIKSDFWRDVCNKTLLRRPDLKIFTAELWDIVMQSGHQNSSTLYHGDLHFNNMFYDLDRQKLTLIDPRGEFYGHWLYDVAKLMHSVFGKFDFIDANLFNPNGHFVKVYSAGTEGIEQIYAESILDKLSNAELKLVYKITASLFASMQPLHKDCPEKIREFEDVFYHFDALANALD